MLSNGMCLGDRYEILKKIGSGGMADVYRAKDRELDRLVALKVLKEEYKGDTAFIKRFIDEAHSAGKLTHPNIVNVYDVSQDKDIFFIVMELIQGITLKDYIRKKKRLTSREATGIALQVCLGLEAAHEMGIIHRDIKPQNIMISTDGKVKVADFGIARAANGETLNASAMGSVHYSSPEQVRGGYSDGKSDIYSLGISMYEMVTGQLPFDGDSTVNVAIKHLQEEIVPPSRIVPNIPRSTEQIILKCTQKSPDKRYQNMAELIRDIKQSITNPNGSFVTIGVPVQVGDTVQFNTSDLQRIREKTAGAPVGTTAPVVGGGFEEKPAVNSAPSQPKAYEDYEEYEEYDAEDDPEDLDFRNDLGQNGSEKTGIEKFLTIGSVVLAVLIVGIALAVLASYMGWVNFGNKRGTRQTEVAESEMKQVSQTEKETETEEVTEKEKETEKQTEENGPVQVPSLRGKSITEAGKILDSMGLKLIVNDKAEYNDMEAGLIGMQAPEGGSSLEKGGSVTVIVSKGPDPNPAGGNHAAVTSDAPAMADNGNGAAVQNSTAPSPAPANTGGTASGSGSTGGEGSSNNSGNGGNNGNGGSGGTGGNTGTGDGQASAPAPAPAPEVSIPEAAVQEYQAVETPVQEQPAVETPVQEQPQEAAPAPEEYYDPPEVIPVPDESYVEEDPNIVTGTVSVPGVIGMSENSAIAALSDAGLNYSIQEDVSPDIARGDVMYQYVDAGSMVNPGSVVTIIVSVGLPDPEEFDEDFQ